MMLKAGVKRLKLMPMIEEKDIDQDIELAMDLYVQVNAKLNWLSSGPHSSAHSQCLQPQLQP